MSEPAFAPVAASERIEVLDALRGFALLGIALMNVEYFTRPLQGMQLGMDPTLVGVDRTVGWLIVAFVQGKFWTLFSLLFGIGFAVMAGRASERGADPGFNRIYLRRLFALLGFGALHAALLWSGDILIPYALGGFVLMLIHGNSARRDLWKIGLGLYLAPMLLLWGAALLIVAAQLDPEGGKAMLAEMSKAGADVKSAYAAAEIAYRDGSWWAATLQRIDDTLMQLQYLWTLLPALVGVFLIGVALLESGIAREPSRHLPTLRRVLWIAGPIGVLLAVLAMRRLEGADLLLPGPSVALGMTMMHIASLLLCLAYASALTLLVLGPLPQLGRLLAPAGRMALSNYLLQSLLLGTLFYGYGFGLWGQVPRAQQALLVLLLFALQLAASHAWFARFRIGPVEWLWRTLTYGRAPLLRR